LTLVPAARDTPIKSCEYRLIIKDRVVDAFADPQITAPVSTYFNPPGNHCNITPKEDGELGNTRSFHREPGSAMCIEAPRVAEVLLLFDWSASGSLLSSLFAICKNSQPLMPVFNSGDAFF
jgi:hypothetical protein